MTGLSDRMPADGESDGRTADVRTTTGRNKINPTR